MCVCVVGVGGAGVEEVEVNLTTQNLSIILNLITLYALSLSHPLTHQEILTALTSKYTLNLIIYHHLHHFGPDNYNIF